MAVRKSRTTYQRVAPDDPDVAELFLHTRVQNEGRIDTSDPADIVELAEQLGVSVSFIIHFHFYKD